MSDKSVAGRMALFALTLAAGQLACAPERSNNHMAPLITSRPDDSQLVTLAGNVRPEALVAANDLGPVADTFTASHMQLQLTRPSSAEHALEQFIASQQTPGSPNFHRWLTAQEFGDQFGLADADLSAITGWMTSHGLRVNGINPGRTTVDFSGNAAQIREAFHTELHTLDVEGKQHIANMSDPQIPAALAPAVVGIVSLHDFRPHNNVKQKTVPAYSAGHGLQAVVPDDLSTIYNLKPLFAAGISGQGETVVVLEDTDVFTPEDWGTFRTKFSLDTYTGGSFTQVHPAPASGENNCGAPGVNGAESEAILDAEWASASAPSAHIELAACADTEFMFGGLIALQNLLNESATPPAIVSMSYGECESVNGAAANAAFNSVFQQAVTEGVSVFVSSGDEGGASCDANQNQATHGIAVSGFASTPYNVAVGGTDFSDTAARKTSTYWSSTNNSAFGSAITYVPEIPWNDSCASEVLSNFNTVPQTYGAEGFCNLSTGMNDLTTGSGSGGPSGCATGTPATPGLVSGACRGWAKPSWQSMFGVPQDGVRDLPDVSLFAANGVWYHYYVYCDSDPDDGSTCDGAPSGWAGAGGTSFASPIMAGIQALVNQKWQTRFGNPNPTYYSIANAEYGTAGSAACNSTQGNKVGSTCTFNDVTEGDIDVNCLGPYGCYTPSGTNGVLSTSASGYAPAFAARAGWDFATGIGTINANNLVNNAAWGAGQTDLSWAPPHQ